jgi:hypothetical protein
MWISLGSLGSVLECGEHEEEMFQMFRAEWHVEL